MTNLSPKPIVTPVTRDLDERGIQYRVFQHPGRVHSLEQAARERGQEPQQVIRSILFRLNPGEYLLVLVAGPEQIPWKNLRRHLSLSRMTMAKPDEVAAVTGYQIGAVSPFGLPAPIRIIADKHIFGFEEMSIGSGVRGTTIILHRDELRRALGNTEIISIQENDHARPN